MQQNGGTLAIVSGVGIKIFEKNQKGCYKTGGVILIISGVEKIF